MRRLFVFLSALSIALLCYSLPKERPHPALYELSAGAARVKVPGYSREEFGGGWATAAHSSCSMRVVVIQAAQNKRDQNCKLADATFSDPYSGRLIGPRGHGEPIEIDHVIPLSAAWDLGAYRWTAAQRKEFANDPLNLIAVSKQQNQEKSDQLPSQWLPSKAKNRCWYVGRVAQVAVRYQLALPRKDIAVMRRQCAGKIIMWWDRLRG
ncbi:HNH endonuclease [Corynebacterium sp. sy017]|uniref:HNH endonuclease family protein n=1 Tax=unclassified Corynebacterium TaxID=2624378 RepID=UPI0011859B69|nr:MULTISPECIES: HNH endonuclease family protein [unclassified Corynebacterium]MBP3088988.1 HNH endonuclease [Corynebacterium sp. sy017]TSD91310.1 HNH endonuclease [Corynebacterium sp. SY003]